MPMKRCFVHWRLEAVSRLLKPVSSNSAGFVLAVVLPSKRTAIGKAAHILHNLCSYITAELNKPAQDYGRVKRNG